MLVGVDPMPRSTWSSRIKLGLTWFSWAFFVLNEIPNLAYTLYLHFTIAITSCLSKRRRRKEEKWKKRFHGVWCIVVNFVPFWNWAGVEQKPPSNFSSQILVVLTNSGRNNPNLSILAGIDKNQPPPSIFLLPLHKWGNGPFASLTPDLLVNGLLENSCIKGVEPTLVENSSRV